MVTSPHPIGNLGVAFHSYWAYLLATLALSRLRVVWGGAAASASALARPPSLLPLALVSSSSLPWAFPFLLFSLVCLWVLPLLPAWERGSAVWLVVIVGFVGGPVLLVNI